MFKNVSTEQTARLVSIIALILGVSQTDATTTIQTTGVVIVGLMQLYGFVRRMAQGDLKLGFMRKQNVKLGVVRK